MAETPHLRLPYLIAAQAQKHVTMNEALRLIDGMVQLAVLDRDLTAPPGSPDEGDRYIPASGATGDWAGWDWNIALWADGAWMKLVPAPGWLAWVEDEGRLLVWDGSGWSGETGALLWSEGQSLTAPQRAQAQANIGLVPQADPLDTTAGRVMLTGAFGLGRPGTIVGNAAVTNNSLPPGLHAYVDPQGSSGGPSGQTHGNFIHMRRAAGGGEAQIFVGETTGRLYSRSRGTNPWNTWQAVLDTGNTIVDGSGFIKEASPVLRVFADRVEPNDEAARQDFTFARQSGGIYTLTGTSGLAVRGWRIEAPQDENGNRLVHVQLAEDDGTIILTTTEPVWHEGRLVAGGPKDIPAGRWVDIRLNSLPETAGEPDDDAA